MTRQLATFLVVVFVCSFSHSKAQESTKAEQAPEITAALAPLRELEAKAAAVKQKRVDQYVADLEALEKTVATGTGDLEQVLAVRKEKEAWAKGKPTDAIDAKDESKPLALRKRRYYFDQEMAKLVESESEARIETLEKVVKELNAMVAQLTREKKIDVAVVARKKRQELEKQLADLKPESPTAPPTLESNQSEPGTLVMIQSWEGSPVVPAIPRKASRYDDIISVHTRDRRWIALRKKGVVITGEGLGIFEPPSKLRNAKFLAFGYKVATAIDEEGISHLWGEPKYIEEQKPVNLSVEVAQQVVSVWCHGDDIFRGVRNDGTLVQWGHAANAKPAPVEGFSEVSSVHGSGREELWVRSIDGVARFYVNGILKYTDEQTRYIALAGSGSRTVGITAEGSLKVLTLPDSQAEIALILPEETTGFTAVRVGLGHTFGARRSDGTWTLFGDQINSGQEELNSKLAEIGPLKDIAIGGNRIYNYPSGPAEGQAKTKKFWHYNGLFLMGIR